MKPLPKTFFILLSIIGMTSVFISVLYGNEHTIVVKPIFHLLLIAFYIVSVLRVKTLAILFYIFAMIGETLVAGGFEVNYKYIILSFVACFTSGTILLYPFLRKANKRFKLPDLIALFVVIVGVGYIMMMSYNIFTERLQEYIQFGMVNISFLLFISCCFYIAAFHSHPKRLSLFIVGACYMITVIGTLIHELYFKSSLLIGIINFAEIIAQFSFVYFILHYHETNKVSSTLI